MHANNETGAIYPIYEIAHEAKKINKDIKIFVESDDDVRFIRRLVRDINERGRSMDSVINQYLTTVKPMYYEFVKPTKRYADIIIPNDKQHDVAVEVIVSKIKEMIPEYKSQNSDFQRLDEKKETE